MNMIMKEKEYLRIRIRCIRSIGVIILLVIYGMTEKIYYVYWSRYFDNNRESGATLRCINKKNKKVKTINAFKTKNNVCIDNTMTIDDGYIYELCESNVYVYSFNGKKVCRINLPSGKQSLYEEGIDSEEYKYLINHSLSVCGDSYILLQ